jgi:hypothetical protein
MERAIAAVIHPYPKDIQLRDSPLWIDLKAFRRACPIMNARKLDFLA